MEASCVCKAAQWSSGVTTRQSLVTSSLNGKTNNNDASGVTTRQSLVTSSLNGKTNNNDASGRSHKIKNYLKLLHNESDKEELPASIAKKIA